MRSSPTLSGRCGGSVAGRPSGVALQGLRSSPTLGGRCWLPHQQPCAAGRRVAILTDPGGPVLARPPVGWQRSPGSCDPHRPSRAGAGAGRELRRVMPRLRSSPTLSGRCWPEPHRSMRRDRVAILTDPLGPVLGLRSSGCRRSVSQLLRSSPTLSGRCWPDSRDEGARPDASMLRSSPTLRAGAGPTWEPGSVLPARVAILTDPLGPVLGAGRGRAAPVISVAILTDPLGPVLAGLTDGTPGTGHTVAILTDPLGPVLAGTMPRSVAAGGCDPHRPSRAGAGASPPVNVQSQRRSCDPHRPSRAGAGSRLRGRR